MTPKVAGLCKCAVGRHPRRARIEARIAGGESYYKVGAAYALGRETLRRHFNEHVIDKDALIARVNALRPSETIAQAQEDAVIEPLELCARKNAQLELAFQQQREAGNWELALAIDKRQIDWSTYQSKLTGPLRRRDLTIVQNNFSAEFSDLERAMFAAARRDPNVTLIQFLHEVRQSVQPQLTIGAQPAND
jgi:hypothetical protein